MERKAPGQIVLAGLTATLVMSGVQAMAPLMGVPRMNIAAMLGSMLGGSVPLGWLMHLVLGSIVWAAIYAYAVEPRLDGAPWVRGLTYGLVLAMVVGIAGFPLVGGMFPSLTPKPGFLGFGSGGIMGAMGVVIGHLVYGVVLGAAYGGQVAGSRSPVAGLHV